MEAAKPKIDITPQTLVGDLLNSYPELEDKLIEISPVFVKLKNPVLRKTVAKVATLKQAAAIGNVSVGELINKLRQAAGMNQIEIQADKNNSSQKPEWVKEDKIKITYDASIDLENGIHPAGKVTKEILELNDEEIYLLITPFVPAPLLKIAEDKGFVHLSLRQNENTVYNYIKKV